MTPAFETNGHLWGYEFDSPGSGILRVTVLDKGGDAVFGPGEPFRR